MVSVQAKTFPAKSHYRNGAAITSTVCYKERCVRHIALQNNRFRMTSCGLQDGDSSLYVCMSKPLLLPGGYLHYTRCWLPNLSYPWLLQQTPPLRLSKKNCAQKLLFLKWLILKGQEKIPKESPSSAFVLNTQLSWVHVQHLLCQYSIC